MAATPFSVAGLGLMIGRVESARKPEKSDPIPALDNGNRYFARRITPPFDPRHRRRRLERIDQTRPGRPDLVDRRRQAPGEVRAHGFAVDSKLASDGGHRDALTMQFQDHHEFPEFDHRALPPANGSSISESVRRRTFQGMPWQARLHENWGIFKRHFWGVYVRHSQFGVIVADPPWRFHVWAEESGSGRSASAHYPVSDLDAIKTLDVRSISADDAVLFLWAPAPMLPQALEVMAAWGFAYKAHVVWLIDKLGLGYWARSKHELLLIGTRGDVVAPAPGTQWPSVIEAPTGKHSAKPEIFLDTIDSLYPNLPKIELYRRGKARPGWIAWGAEAD